MKKKRNKSLTVNSTTFYTNNVTKIVSQQSNFVLLNKYKNNHLKNYIMSYLLYVIAVILVIIWAVGFFAYSAGSIIHVLLVIAIIAIILRLIRGGRPV